VKHTETVLGHDARRLTVCVNLDISETVQCKDTVAIQTVCGLP